MRGSRPTSAEGSLSLRSSTETRGSRPRQRQGSPRCQSQQAAYSVHHSSSPSAGLPLAAALAGPSEDALTESRAAGTAAAAGTGAGSASPVPDVTALGAAGAAGGRRGAG